MNKTVRDILLFAAGFGAGALVMHTVFEKKYETYYGKRYEETFVETSQNQIDQEDADGVDENRLRTTAACFFACHTAIFVPVSCRQHLGSHFLDGLLYFTRGISRCRVYIDRDTAKEVETIGYFRSEYPF